MERTKYTTKPKIVLFDDDEAKHRLYSTYFRLLFDLKGFQNPFHYPEALKEDLSAILIDVMMPVKDGFELYEEIQEHPDYNGCPLIFISASGCGEVLKGALNCGGHDFLSTSMTKDEMVLRVKNKVDFFKANRTIHRLGNIKINTQNLRATHQGENIELTLTEIKIMKHLIREYPNFSSREEITREVWPGLKVMPTTLNTHLCNLRSKFANWEFEIVNLKGKGIHLSPKNSTTSG